MWLILNSYLKNETYQQVVGKKVIPLEEWSFSMLVIEKISCLILKSLSRFLRKQKKIIHFCGAFINDCSHC